MAYTALPTVATADYWTLTQMRTYLRDNWIVSVPDTNTLSYSLWAGTGSKSAEEIPVGSNYQSLIADSSQSAGMKWGDTFNVTLLRKSGDQTMASASEDITWETEDEDDDGLHSGSSASVTFVDSCIYLIMCHLAIEATGTGDNGDVYAEMIKNSTTMHRGYWREQNSNKGYIELYGLNYFVNTDTFKITVTESMTGGTNKILQNYSFLALWRLGEYP